MNPSNIPNLITLGRFFLVVPVIYFQWQGQYIAALLTFFIAGFSDALDGFLAKRYNWGSRLGAIMDPLADKLLLISTSVVLALQGHIPFWLLFLMVGRDLVIMGGALSYHLLFGNVPMEPRLASKINTFFQILLVIVVMLTLGLRPDWLPWIDIVLYVVAATAIISGLDYVILWSARARGKWSTRRG